MTTTAEYDERAHELNWVAVWRATPDHPVAGLRLALADLLATGVDRLDEALRDLYADDPATATAYVQTYVDGFAASEDVALHRAGQLLHDARAGLWDSDREGLQ